MSQCWPPGQFNLLSQHVLTTQAFFSVYLSNKWLVHFSLCMLSFGFIALTKKQEALWFEEAEIQGAGSLWAMPPLRCIAR